MPRDCKFITPVANGIRLFVRLSPKAKREGIEGLYQDPDGRERLKIAVNAPPVDGKANQELIKQLAKLLNLPKSSITLVAGAADRNKTILITGESAVLISLLQAEVPE